MSDVRRAPIHRLSAPIQGVIKTPELFCAALEWTMLRRVFFAACFLFFETLSLDSKVPWSGGPSIAKHASIVAGSSSQSARPGVALGVHVRSSSRNCTSATCFARGTWPQGVLMQCVPARNEKNNPAKPTGSSSRSARPGVSGSSSRSARPEVALGVQDLLKDDPGFLLKDPRVLLKDPGIPCGPLALVFEIG